MSGKVDLVCLSYVSSDQEMEAQVAVSGGKPNSLVTVCLQQKRGAQPRLSQMAQVAAVGDDGAVSVGFDIKLAGPGLAVLTATAYDATGTFFESDAETVEVR